MADRIKKRYNNKRIKEINGLLFIYCNNLQTTSRNRGLDVGRFSMYVYCLKMY